MNNMTGTSARNSFSIFKSKKAFILAKKYNLSLTDKNSYIHFNNLIEFSDVKFIVDNLWLDHFMYGTPQPIDVSIQEYDQIFYYLRSKWNFPLLNSYSIS